MTTFVDQGTAVRVFASVGTTWWLRDHLPWRPDDPVLVLVAWHQPTLFTTLHIVHAVLLVTTPYLAWSVVCSVVYIVVAHRHRTGPPGPLPRYPEPASRQDLFLVVGEQHHPLKPVPARQPTWLTIPERGLFTGVAVIGAVGSGKTTGCLYPFADQILGYRRADAERRIGGLVLEVKGDFCHEVHAILQSHGRASDYLEVSLEGPWRYNPLHADLDAYALAYGIASLLNNVFGKGKEPFWQQAYTNLIKFIILLHKVVDDYVTLFDVYECAINPEQLARKITEGEQKFPRVTQISVHADAYLAHPALAEFTLQLDSQTGRMTGAGSGSLHEYLDSHSVPYEESSSTNGIGLHDDPRRDQFEAVKRWFDHDWRRIEPKLRTSIVEGISVFLSLFDDSPAMKRVFCPPKACYDPITNADGRWGRPLPAFRELIEQGRVCALNFPMAENPGLAKIIGTLMKQDFQRAVIGRIPAMMRRPGDRWREVLFLCDEYHAFATVGEDDPTGDEKFFSVSRQARCIAIVATQSISSLRSTLPGETWRTLLQTFRTKIFLALSDDFSARVASDLCGKDDRLTPQYQLSESGQDARISVLTGRAAAHRATISTSKSYVVHRDAVFEAKVFGELKNGQAIVLTYDGFNPHPPTYCYLKPCYLDPNATYFEQVARGLL